MKLNLSIILTIAYLTFCLVLYFIPSQVYYNFRTDHFFFARVVVYFIRYFPWAIIIVSLFELFKKEKAIQAFISLSFCIGFLLLICWALRPKKGLIKEDIGRISFETNGQGSDYDYYCKFDFTLQIGIELESDEIKNEIKSNNNYILELVKRTAKKNCYKEHLEEYINRTCLDSEVV